MAKRPNGVKRQGENISSGPSIAPLASRKAQLGQPGSDDPARDAAIGGGQLAAALTGTDAARGRCRTIR
jgi:hypothetical protein